MWEFKKKSDRRIERKEELLDGGRSTGTRTPRVGLFTDTALKSDYLAKLTFKATQLLTRTCELTCIDSG